jgi:hypothetical protein
MMQLDGPRRQDVIGPKALEGFLSAQLLLFSGSFGPTLFAIWAASRALPLEFQI